jgi:hypothetical protein
MIAVDLGQLRVASAPRENRIGKRKLARQATAAELTDKPLEYVHGRNGQVLAWCSFARCLLLGQCQAGTRMLCALQDKRE